MKYGELTLGQVEAIVNKLGGMEGVKRFLSSETVVKEMERKFKTWKTINLGTGLETAEDFRRALRDGEFWLSAWASDILGKPAFTAATEESEVDLVKVTVAELGFKGAQRDQIYARAKELGLELCPAEVGPQLRLQYQDQPNGEWITVAMEEPIHASDGNLWLFFVGRGDSGLWLSSYCSDPDGFWVADEPWVFCRPCK